MVELAEAYKEILDRFIKLYNQVENVSDKKLFIGQFVEQTEGIKWRGLSRIVEKIGDDILSKERTGMVLATIARIIARDFPGKAKDLISTVERESDVLFEWSFDAALAFGLITETLIELNDLESAKKFLDRSISYALKIPDRSDRSIALARLMPLIYRFYDLDVSLGYLEKITYEIKRVEAIVKLIHATAERGEHIDLKKLLPYTPKEKRTYILSEWTRSWLRTSVDMAYDLANNFIKYAESDPSNIDNVRALMNFLVVYLNKSDGDFSDSTVSSIFNKIKSTIISNIYKREYMALLFDVLDLMLSFDNKKTAQQFLSEMRSYLPQNDASIEIFIFNRLARVYAKHQHFDEVNLYLSNGFQTLQNVDVVVRTPLLVDTLSTTLFAINEFPEDVPIKLAEEYAKKIKPAEIAEIKIKIFRDNLAYLSEKYGRDRIDQAINEVVQMDRLLNLKDLELRAKDILTNLLEKRDGSFILNYILKYSYEANLPETTRLEILELLGSATSALLRQDVSKAREYTELALREFERRGVPLLPIILRFFQEYLIMTLP